MVKKIIAAAAALCLLLALAGCQRSAAEIDWSSSSVAARVEKIKGSTVTLTLGVITREPAPGASGPETPEPPKTEQKDPAPGDGSAADKDPAASGGDTAGGNTAPQNGGEDIAQQQQDAGGVSFGDGGAAGDYEAPAADSTGPQDTGSDASQQVSGSRFVSGDTTIKLTLSDTGILSSLMPDGSSQNAKLEDLSVGDIVTVDFNSKGVVGSMVLRRDLKTN